MFKTADKAAEEVLEDIILPGSKVADWVRVIIMQSTMENMNRAITQLTSSSLREKHAQTLPGWLDNTVV